MNAILALEIHIPSLPYPVIQVLGWAVFVGYLLVAVMCWHATLVLQRDPDLEGAAKRLSVWRFMATFMLLMAVNKQLDLHSHVYDFLRDVAAQQGFNAGERQLTHLLFVIILAGIGLVLLLWLASVLGEALKRYKIALAGIALMMVAVAIRIGTLKAFDRLFGWKIDGWNYNWAIETAALFLVAWSSRRAIRQADASDDPDDPTEMVTIHP